MRRYDCLARIRPRRSLCCKGWLKPGFEHLRFAHDFVRIAAYNQNYLAGTVLGVIAIGDKAHYLARNPVDYVTNFSRGLKTESRRGLQIEREYTEPQYIGAPTVVSPEDYGRV